MGVASTHTRLLGWYIALRPNFMFFFVHNIAYVALIHMTSYGPCHIPSYLTPRCIYSHATDINEVHAPSHYRTSSLLCGRAVGRVMRLAPPSVRPSVPYGLITRKRISGVPIYFQLKGQRSKSTDVRDLKKVPLI